MEERESPAYYRGALDAYEEEVADFHSAIERLGDCRLWQWEKLLRDYESVLRELEELKEQGGGSGVNIC